MSSGKVGAEVRLAAMPTLEPSIGGGDREWEGSLMPDAMKRESLNDSLNQLKELAGGDAGACNEVAPENGESAAAASTAVAVGAKKRSLLTSRRSLWAWYPEE